MKEVTPPKIHKSQVSSNHEAKRNYFKLPKASRSKYMAYLGECNKWVTQVLLSVPISIYRCMPYNSSLMPQINLLL